MSYLWQECVHVMLLDDSITSQPLTQLGPAGLVRTPVIFVQTLLKNPRYRSSV